MLLCPKVREQFGGKLEFMIVGGAPLSPQLQALIKASLNVTLAQGFGATETLGAVICMDDNDLSYGRCGAPLNGVRLKLIDWIEGEYKVIDKPNPRGELVVGGYNIASGYYNNPKLTEESFSEDDNGRRWFFTGDIAEVFPDGTFKIIDRKKDLIKLANGEYFSLGKVSLVSQT
jgi:long-chain acyl-CoA synthetase